MIPLLTALANACTEALKAYTAHLSWQIKTHKQTTIDSLEDEKIRLTCNGNPTDKLRLEVIAGRIQRAKNE